MKVDANDTATNAAVNSITDTSFFAEVPGSQQRAFFVDKTDSISSTSFAPGLLFFYNQHVTASDSVASGTTTTLEQLPNSNSYTESWLAALNSNFTYNEDLAYRLEHGGTRAIAINAEAPTPTNLQTISVDGESISVPSGALWFKPIAYGDCIISFGVTNMNDDRYKSIYKFKRNPDGTIDQSSWTETTLVFNKKSSDLKNSSLVFYHYQITEQDILEGYEYCIGTTTNQAPDSTCLFYFLALAGTSSTGGTITPESKELFEVNFIHALPYEHTSVLGPEYKVTTFKLTLPTTNAGSEYYVTFARQSMSVHATATTPGGMTVTKYEHYSPPQS